QGSAFGFSDDGFQVIQRPGHGGDAHGGSVAVAVVGTGVVLLEPADEAGAVARRGITARPIAQGGGEVRAGAQGVGDGDGKDGVVGEAGAGSEEGEVTAAGRGAFVDGADDVSDDGA